MKILWTACTECQFGQLERVPRSAWMRLMPSLRHYHCGQCSTTLLAPKDMVEAKQWLLSTFKNLAQPVAAKATDKSEC